MTAPIWTPSTERIGAAQLTQFGHFAQQRHGAPGGDFAALQQWSTRQPADFWQALWAFSEVRSSRPAQAVLENESAMPGARWFPGARLNFAENLLRFRDERTALLFQGEDGQRSTLSYAALYREVARTAAGLRAAGVAPGDRVAGVLSNCPAAVIAMLATTSIGAVWSSCSPDFGASGIADRFSQIEPRVLFVTDGYSYNGKRIDSLPRIARVVAGIASIEQIVTVPFLADHPAPDGLPGAISWQSFQQDSEAIEFAQLPFDHPVYILYSSGTTGAPKCIVHGAGGTLLQHLKELRLHSDVGRDDRLFFYTTCGWMMWNWLVSGLAVGATVALYDGSPFYPGPAALWEFAAREGVTVFGAGARYYSAVEKEGYSPRRACDLAALRTVLSTGSPLAEESYDFIYAEVAADVQLSSISGGTDIVSCFALGCPVLPVYRGELQCLGLGMAVAIFDDDGQPVQQQKGELVCTAPFPSMPVGFWNDADGARYRAAYFERFPGVWCHGDFAELTAHGGLIIHGRSDAVLNPGGVRIGTAEIYRQAELLDEILESVAIGQEWDGDVRVVLFVRLREGLQLDEDLIARLRMSIRTNASPRHVPAKILAVPDIPRTISGKIVELAVREVVHGRAVKNTDALANPAALEYFRDRPELREA